MENAPKFGILLGAFKKCNLKKLFSIYTLFMHSTADIISRIVG